MKNQLKKLSSLLTVVAMIFALAACSQSKKSNNKPQEAPSASSKSGNGGQILGAGSTFAYPIYTKMFQVYNKEKGIQVNYQGIGSGGGIRQLESKIIDFGGSDAPLSDADEQKAPAFIVHIPTCLGAVTISYNLPGSPQLRFDSAVLADIYLGKIKNGMIPASRL